MSEETSKSDLEERIKELQDAVLELKSDVAWLKRWVKDDNIRKEMAQYNRER